MDTLVMIQLVLLGLKAIKDNKITKVVFLSVSLLCSALEVFLLLVMVLLKL